MSSDDVTVVGESSALNVLLDSNDDFVAAMESYASGVGAGIAHVAAYEGLLGDDTVSASHTQYARLGGGRDTERDRTHFVRCGWMVSAQVTTRYAPALIDVLQSTLWVLMFFAPSYIWPALGICISIATLVLCKKRSIEFTRPLLIGILLFHLLAFAWPFLFQASPTLLAAYCVAIGVLTGERITLFAILRRRELTIAENHEPKGKDQAPEEDPVPF